MRLGFLSLAIIPTIITAAVARPPQAFAADCAPGVEGIAEPSSVVCAESEAGELWCDRANEAGDFNIQRGGISPSTSGECLPTSGPLVLSQYGCAWNGIRIDRGDAAQQYGGPWVDIRCN